MKVAILPTGRTEWYGLPRALRRLFPDHDFVPVPTREELFTEPKRFPYPGVTSTPLTSKQLSNPPGPAFPLIERAVQEAFGDRKAEAADIVLILDDVEVLNRGHEDLVLAVFRAAVEQHLQNLSSDRLRGRTAEVLRNRVSFHLARPMIESWFFADPAALAEAGVDEPCSSHVLLSDPEQFEIRIADYIQAKVEHCPCWNNLPKTKANEQKKPKWLGARPREYHPKGYLQWLCRDGSAETCTRYDEAQGGAKALANLDWSLLLGRPAEQLPYLRAIVSDLAMTPGNPTVPVFPGGSSHTSPFLIPQNPVLRNL